MALDNDKTIFSFLNPTSNDIIHKLSDSDIKELLLHLDRYYLEYRSSLGINKDITFGIEIEVEHFKCSVHEYWAFQLLLNQLVGKKSWDSKNDISLLHGQTDFGREVSSDILTDIPDSWADIKKVCEFMSQYGVIGSKCGSHVHVGAQILGENPIYWYRFLELCSVYENILYRFGYGEYLSHRPGIATKAMPGALFYDSKTPIIYDKLSGNLYDLLMILASNPKVSDSLKYYGVSFWHMLCDNNFDRYEDFNTCNKYCTVEYRAPNGTLDPVIWQNNINFFIKLLLFCKSDKFDEDIINRRRLQVYGLMGDLPSYSEIYFDQAVELCDMIFDNNVDKIYFLRQYLKSFEVANKPMVRARRFTELSKN